MAPQPNLRTGWQDRLGRLHGRNRRLNLNSGDYFLDFYRWILASGRSSSISYLRAGPELYRPQSGCAGEGLG